MAGRGTDILLGGNPAGLASEIAPPAGPQPGRGGQDDYDAALAEAKAITEEDHDAVVGGRRPAHHRHRAPRQPAHRQPAPRPRRPPGRPGLVALLPVARGRPHEALRLGPRRRPDGAHGLEDDVAIESRLVSQDDRERPDPRRGLQLRHPQARRRVRRRHQQAARDDLRRARQGPPQRGPHRDRPRLPRGRDRRRWSTTHLHRRRARRLGPRGAGRGAHGDGPRRATAPREDDARRGRRTREALARAPPRISPTTRSSAKAEPTATRTGRIVERLVLLRTIDSLWVEHLTELDDMRRGIGLRGYAQQDPLNEFRKEAFRLYEELRGPHPPPGRDHDLPGDRHPRAAQTVPLPGPGSPPAVAGCARHGGGRARGPARRARGGQLGSGTAAGATAARPGGGLGDGRRHGARPPRRRATAAAPVSGPLPADPMQGARATSGSGTASTAATGRRAAGLHAERRADRAQRPLLVRIGRTSTRSVTGPDRPARGSIGRASDSLVGAVAPSSLAAATPHSGSGSRAIATSSGRRTRSSSSAPPSTTAGRPRCSRHGSTTPSRLYRAGVAPLLVVTGGKADGDRTTEAAVAAPTRSRTACPRRRSSARTRAGTRSTRCARVGGAAQAARPAPRGVRLRPDAHAARPADRDDLGHRAYGSPTPTSPDRRATPSRASGAVHELGALAASTSSPAARRCGPPRG